MSSQAPSNNTPALGVLTSLFFMMGAITSLNDVLIPHLKNAFSLNYTQAMLINMVFFGAYALMSIPMGKVVEKLGYKNGVIGGFLIAALGCLLFYPASTSLSYPVFLSALFILASGITLLQVAGNPYVTLLSKPGKESATLTLVQAFNSVGTTVAPPLGGLLILAEASQHMNPLQEAQSVQIPYLGLAGVLILLAVFVKLIRLPDAKAIAEAETEHNHDGKTSVWQYKHMILGAVAIFCYVGAEVAIGSLLINVMEAAAGVTHLQGSKLIAFYWGGAMVGRFLGSAVMSRFQPSKYLMFNSVMAMILIAVAILSGGKVAMFALLGVGFFNSIMFPTIFSLATRGLGKFTGAASGIICTAIVGGAIIPFTQGMLIDGLTPNMGATGALMASFVLPILCYLYIAFFAAKGHKVD
ncbi:sugar MFS transporter [Neisseria canis]|uniref:Sugar transporter n=1 Tax=Neisseria canis TaxID=493 RepID=A0A1X3CX05_9NEIS|nr:sugar MFS transporter [Neisseria canis]OSI12180.1 glucose/galactose MFS transporter [Neisseria canis]VEF01270.1 sugar transporter [Neisseria canis]